LSVLADYQDSIPNASSIIDVLPPGWDAKYWQSHTVAEIVEGLTAQLLLNL
jgi:hypothetical protein